MNVENLKWFFDRLFHISLSFITELMIKKDKETWLFGFKSNSYKNRESFMQSSKYMFLYASNYDDINAIWLCDDKSMIKEFHRKGYKKVYSRKSLKGIWAIISAKYWFCDITPNQICKFHSSVTKATIINFWHGESWKKSGYDDETNLYYKMNPFIRIIYNLICTKENYFISNNEWENEVYKTSFRIKDEQLKKLCSPRLDVLLKDIPNSTIFIEQNYNAIKKEKQNGKNIFIYMPTYRDDGENISSWINSNELNSFLEETNSLLVCKLHPADINSLNYCNSSNVITLDSNIDIYPLLKYTDALISDYSAIAFDYLLLDKPIIYHVPDLESYQKRCRGFYVEYDRFVAGPKTSSTDELLTEMTNVVLRNDKFKLRRDILRKTLFKYRDGNNCKRIYEWIKTLDN